MKLITYFLLFLITTSFLKELEAKKVQKCITELPYRIRKTIAGKDLTVSEILQALPPGHKEAFSACIEPGKAAKEGKIVTALERIGRQRAQ